MDKKDLQYAYFLIDRFVESINNKKIDRNYLLELQQWFIEQFEVINKSGTCTIKHVTFDGSWQVANNSPEDYNYIMRIPVHDQDLWLASSTWSFKESALYSTKKLYTEDKSNINFEVEREK